MVYHLGPLTLTAYGIGLALSLWFGVAYTERRLRRGGCPSAWVPGTAGWVIAAALLGARLADVAASPGYYGAHPGEALAVWHGGLSSFGGLALGVPTALWMARRRAAAVGLARAADLAVPALVASWAVGRLLACQFEVGGGGPPTTAWWGLRYAGQVGRRVPVPLLQSGEDWLIFALLVLLERRLARRGGPPGVVVAAGVGLWGLGRFFDQFLWLARGGGAGAYLTEAAGLALAVAGLSGVVWLLARRPATARHVAPERAGRRPAGPAAAIAGADEAAIPEARRRASDLRGGPVASEGPTTPRRHEGARS